MSITRKFISALVALAALTVMAPSQAETPTEAGQKILSELVDVITQPLITFNVSKKDEDCLARNIYYEAGSEPEEGKVAVGIVTINRVKDGRFANSICGVVNQRLVRTNQKITTEVHIVDHGWLRGKERVEQKSVSTRSISICQFSWVCGIVHKPKDDRWEESQRIAQMLLSGEYQQWIEKYASAMYFHSTRIRPVWAKQKTYIARVGGHVFYSEREI